MAFIKKDFHNSELDESKSLMEAKEKIWELEEKAQKYYRWWKSAESFAPLSKREYLFEAEEKLEYSSEYNLVENVIATWKKFQRIPFRLFDYRYDWLPTTEKEGFEKKGKATINWLLQHPKITGNLYLFLFVFFPNDIMNKDASKLIREMVDFYDSNNQLYHIYELFMEDDYYKILDLRKSGKLKNIDYNSPIPSLDTNKLKEKIKCCEPSKYRLWAEKFFQPLLEKEKGYSLKLLKEEITNIIIEKYYNENNIKNKAIYEDMVLGRINKELYEKIIGEKK